VPGASSLLLDLITRLSEPLVRPLRRFIPLVGGVDLSPLAAIVLLQVGAIVLGSLMGWAWALGR
jgi:YggT family protein